MASISRAVSNQEWGIVTRVHYLAFWWIIDDSVRPSDSNFSFPHSTIVKKNRAREFVVAVAIYCHQKIVVFMIWDIFTGKLYIKMSAMLQKFIEIITFNSFLFKKT